MGRELKIDLPEEEQRHSVATKRFNWVDPDGGKDGDWRMGGNTRNVRNQRQPELRNSYGGDQYSRQQNGGGQYPPARQNMQQNYGTSTLSKLVEWSKVPA